jgi:WD40 repeat protein
MTRVFLAVVGALLLAAPLPADPPRPDAHGDPLPPGAVARLGTTRLRHADSLTHVVYSPDGKLLATLSRDRTLRVWDAATGRQVHLFQEKDVDYYAVAWSPDGTTLAAAGGDPFHGGNASIRFFDLATAKETLRFDGHLQPAYSVSYSPDGKTLISMSCDQVIRWDAGTGVKLDEWKLPTTAALAVSPDRAALAWVNGETESKVINVGEAATGKMIRKLKGHKQAVVSVAWSPNGKYIASGNPMEPIHLWDAATGKLVRKFDQQQGGLTLKFSADSKTLACGCTDGTVGRWEVETGNELPKLTGYRGWVQCLAFAPDGSTLALAGADSQMLHLWDLATATPRQAAPGHHGQIYAVAYSPDGKLLATGGGDWHDNDQNIYLWDAATGQQVRKLTGHLGKVYSLAFSPDGKRLVSGGEKEDFVHVWDVATGAALPRFQRKTDNDRATESRVSAVAFSPDGKLVASAQDQGIISLWDFETRAELQQCKGHEGMINSLCFAPDGKEILSGSVDHTVRLWDAATGQEKCRFGDPGDSVKCVTFSPDGRLVAASAGDYEGQVFLWETATAKEVGRLGAARGRVYQIAFSPDGKLLAGTGADNTLCLWEVATRSERCRFPGHPHGCLALAFAPDGRTIGSGSQDTTVLVWEVAHCPDVARPKTDDDLVQLWSDLGSQDGKTAHRAICALLAEPDKAVRFLNQRLRPFGVMDADRIARALNDLDDEQFKKREKATTDLAKLGELAEPFLRQTLERDPSVEVRQRVQLLLSKLDTATLAQDQLRTLRGFEVLERIGGSEARGVFETHAQQLGASRLGREAQACLDRINQRR